MIIRNNIKEQIVVYELPLNNDMVVLRKNSYLMNSVNQIILHKDEIKKICKFVEDNNVK